MPRPRYEKGGLYERLTCGAPLAVLLAAGLYIAYELLRVLELVAIAILIALVLRTLVNLLSKIGLKPWMSVLVLLGALVACGIFLWQRVVPNVVQEVEDLTTTVPSYLGSLAEQSRQLSDSVSFLPDFSDLLDRLQNLFYEQLGSVPQWLTGAGYIAGEVVAVLFLSLYLSINPGRLVEGTLRLVPEERRDRAREVLYTMESRLRGWILGTGVAMLVVGVGVGIGLWIIGVPLALTFGILAGILELIPYFGQIVAALLPALLALTISPVKALLVVVLFTIVNQIDGHIIQPLVMGSSVRLHPAVVLIAFLAFGTLLGFVGVLLAVPAAVCLAVLVDELSSPEEGSNEAATQKSQAETKARS